MTDTILRYPINTLTADYVRAASGLALTAAPLLLIETSGWIGVLLGSCAILFGVFLVATWRRHMTTLHVDDTRVTARGPLGRSIAWADLTHLKLAYYSTRRDRRDGWMELTLKASDASLKVNSNLQCFDDVVSRATRAAERNGVTLNAATLDNLAALGVCVDGLQDDRAPQTGDPTDRPGGSTTGAEG